MPFVEKYVRALNSSDLRDDEHHSATHALTAAALADQSGGEVLGSLLARAKYADGVPHKTFEAGSANLAGLLRIWKAAVAEKGRSRGWLKPRTAWDVEAAYRLYDTVAEASLAHWLDGRCGQCGGSGSTQDRRICGSCKGTGKEEITGRHLEAELIRDMVSELEGLFQAHSGRAAAKMRRAA